MDFFLTFTDSYYFISIFTFTLSILITYLLLKERIIPNHYSEDIDYGHQKIHKGNIKRIGGLSIVFSMIIFLIIEIVFFGNNSDFKLYFIFFYCCIIFLIGFLEDLIKDIKPRTRLLLLFICSCLWLIDSENLIRYTNIDFIDNLIQIEIISIILTLFCIISSINATNMMDGANGLLTIFVISVCSILSFYAFNANDTILLKFLFMLIGSFLGFLIFNWPKAKIFLGDGGSYFIGSILSSLLIFMSNHLSNFNMLNALVIMLYPSWELMFTVFRRVYSSSKITEPDNLHLHTIIHANIKRMNLTIKYKINSNALSGLIVNLIALLPPIIFLNYKFGDDLQDKETLLFYILCIISYTIIYLILEKKNNRQ